MLNALWQNLFTALIRQFVEVEDGAKKHDYREYDDDATHNLVDDEYSVVVEFASYRVDKPCQTEPPEYRSEQDANITHAHFNGTVGHDKGELREKEYEKEYGTDRIEMHEDALCSDDVVLIHDDLLATGGTMKATVNMVKRFNPKACYINFLIEIRDEGLAGREFIGDDTPKDVLINV